MTSRSSIDTNLQILPLSGLFGPIRFIELEIICLLQPVLRAAEGSWIWAHVSRPDSSITRMTDMHHVSVWSHRPCSVQTSVSLSVQCLPNTHIQTTGHMSPPAVGGAHYTNRQLITAGFLLSFLSTCFHFPYFWDRSIHLQLSRMIS